MKSLRLPLALVATAAFWGSSFVATKILLRELPPAVIVTLRFALGLIVLGVAARSGGISLRTEGADRPSILLLGFLGIALHQWLQANGLKTASATATAWIVASIPVMTALMGALVLHERLTLGRAGGILVAGIGVVMVVGKGDPLALLTGRVGSIGDLLIGASALNWTVFTILSRRLFSDQPSVALPGRRVAGRPLAVMFSVMAVGWALTLVWAIVEGGWERLLGLSPAGWIALIYLGVACSGLAYFFWYQALEEMDASEAGVYLYLEPLVTTVLASALLGEAISAVIIVGGGMIFLGVWLVERRA